MCSLLTDAVCDQKCLNIIVYGTNNKCYGQSVTEEWCELYELKFDAGLERYLKPGQEESGREGIPSRRKHIKKFMGGKEYGRFEGVRLA